MNILDIKEGNCLRMIGQNLDEFVIVSGINIKENKIVVSDIKGDPIVIDMKISGNLISPISLSDDILRKLGYIKESRTLYGLPSTDVYSQYFGDFLVEIIYCKEKGWCLVIPSSDSFFGCKSKPIPHLSDLQNILSQSFHYIINLKSLILDNTIINQW